MENGDKCHRPPYGSCGSWLGKEVQSKVLISRKTQRVALISILRYLSLTPDTGSHCKTTLCISRGTFLLSSRTVFMFSIQTASTGPSNSIHLRVSVKLDAYSRNVFANTPSRMRRPDTQRKKSYNSSTTNEDDFVTKILLFTGNRLVPP